MICLSNILPNQTCGNKYAGRIGDYLKFSHPQGLYTAKIEQDLINDPLVYLAVVGGHGRRGPCLLLELKSNVRKRRFDEKIIGAIWPSVEKINQDYSKLVQFTKDMTIIVDSSRPIERTAKNTVARNETFALYDNGIEKMYGNGT